MNAGQILQDAIAWYVADAALKGTPELKRLRASVEDYLRENPLPEPQTKKGDKKAWAICGGSYVVLARNKTDARRWAGFGGMTSISCKPATMEQVRYYLACVGRTELEEAKD